VGYIKSYLLSIYPNIEVKIFKDIDSLLAEVKKVKPSIVGFSFYYWNQNLNYYAAQKIRAIYGRSIPIVFGGPSVDTDQGEKKKIIKTFPEVDFFIEGEGEAGFAKLVERYLEVNKKYEDLFNSPIDGCISRIRGNSTLAASWIEGENVSNNLELAKVPSPYTSGYLDEFIEKKYFPLLQATRTCPYGCTFCVSGKDRKKLRAFPLEQVKAEINYIAEKYKDSPHVILNLAELNFGINDQDPEIARYLKEVSDNIGYPKSVYFYSDKRFTERSKSVISELGDINRDGLVFSLQSDSPETLKAINRKNLPDNSINAGISWAMENNIPVTTELIFGLPYETLDSMMGVIEKSITQGFDSIMVHNLFLMEGVELNRDFQVMFHGMKTKIRLLGSSYTKIDEDFIFEYERVVVENNYFSRDDFRKIRKINMLLFAVFQGSFYKIFFRSLPHFGISITKFFDIFMNPSELYTYDQSYISFISEFSERMEDELFDNIEDLRDYALAIYGVNNDVGEPVRLNPYFLSKLLAESNTWFEKTLIEILSQHFPVQYQEISQHGFLNEALEICRKQILNLDEPVDKIITFNESFDFQSWLEGKCIEHPLKFIQIKRKMHLGLTDTQQLKIRGFLSESSDLQKSDLYFNAVETIFPRVDLYRKYVSEVS
jgi:radical SAM superfamily enzyme YgiQ (UPF0313 family)